MLHMQVQASLERHHRYELAFKNFIVIGSSRNDPALQRLNNNVTTCNCENVLLTEFQFFKMRLGPFSHTHLLVLSFCIQQQPCGMQG